MTFLFHPHRSSSDEELLDQQLNEWVGGFGANDTGTADSDPIAFHRWANDTRRSDLAATGPAAGTWDRILRQTAQESPKGTGTMSSANSIAARYAAIDYDSKPFNRKGFHIGRFFNIAATVAIVIAVSVGGWLTMSQMPGGDGRFAAIPGTPDVAQSQTCDVEPLSVDEVMEIVKNPYTAYDVSPGQFSLGVPEGFWNELAEPMDMRVDLRKLDQDAPAPDEDSFENASTRMEQFLGCLQVGNVGQIFQFLLPNEVQRIILAIHPVFRDEEQVRASVEKVLPMPASRVAAPLNEAITDPGLVFASNPDRESARDFPLHEARMYESEQLLLIGIRVINDDGEIVFENTASGSSNPVGSLKTTDRMRVVMVQSMYDDEWYVLATIPE